MLQATNILFEGACVSITYMYMWGTIGFRARLLTELFLWLAHVCDWSLWWVGAGPVVSPPASFPGVPSAQINHWLMEANISFLDTLMWVRQSSVSIQCDSTVFLTDWSWVWWLMLWCEWVYSLVGSGTANLNETKACSSHWDQSNWS